MMIIIVMFLSWLLFSWFDDYHAHDDDNDHDDDDGDVVVTMMMTMMIIRLKWRRSIGGGTKIEQTGSQGYFHHDDEDDDDDHDDHDDPENEKPSRGKRPKTKSCPNFFLLKTYRYVVYV